MNEFSAFTTRPPGRVNAIITECGVSDAYDPHIDKGSHPTVSQYQAIWDTGATGTVITAKVAKELGLKPTGLVTSNHAGGTSQVNTYLVNVYLPNKIVIPGVRVVEAVLSGDIEMLIGMDIIAHGDFSFTNVNGQSCFTFRIPSVKEIDYVEEAKKNNKPSWLKPGGGGYKKKGKKKR